MLCKRIIPCLDVKNGTVVKGIRFQDHKIVGGILHLAQHYSEMGADELVFYDITASCEDRVVDYTWVSRVAEIIDIPFCVAGGIRTLTQAERILCAGVDKISINSPALEKPSFINELTNNFGSQAIVIGIDSKRVNNEFMVFQYTGNELKTKQTPKLTENWLREVQDRGAGEIVLNCMDLDGTQSGYDLSHLIYLQSFVNLPLIASGGAGTMEDFVDLFTHTNVSGALAASVFHNHIIQIPALKNFLNAQKIEVRHVI